MLVEFDKFTAKVLVIDRLLVRGGFQTARIRLRNNGALYSMGAGEAVSLMLRERNKFDGVLCASVSLTSAELDVDSGEYRKSFSTNTAGVLTALRFNANSSDDLAEAFFHGTCIHHNVGDTVQTPSLPFELIIANTNYNGAVDNPSTVNGITNPGYWTSIDAGNDTSLNSVITADGAWPLMGTIATAINGNYIIWQLQTNTGGVASDGVNFQRPLDFNALTNNVIWVKIS